MVLLSAAWTKGILMPARAETAAVLPAALRKARREVVGKWDGFMVREAAVGGRGVSMPRKNKGRLADGFVRIVAACFPTLPETER